MLQVQTLLSAKCIDEDELKKAEKKLKDLTERFDYGPAWLNLAELYSNGYEPGIEANPEEYPEDSLQGGGESKVGTIYIPSRLSFSQYTPPS